MSVQDVLIDSRCSRRIERRLYLDELPIRLRRIHSAQHEILSTTTKYKNKMIHQSNNDAESIIPFFFGWLYVSTKTTSFPRQVLKNRVSCSTIDLNVDQTDNGEFKFTNVTNARLLLQFECLYTRPAM